MELQRRLADFQAAHIAVFVVVPEPVEMLAAFVHEHGISYPVLSDADSAVIREFGILNTLIDEGEPRYGLPFPGSYLVGEDGTVGRKFFHRRYQERETAEVVLHDGFSLPLDMSGNPTVSDGAAVTATLGGEGLAVAQLAELYVRIELADGLHAYGQPVPDGYIATEVTVTAPESVQVGAARYPRTRPFRVAGIEEQFHVFEGDIEVTVPLMSMERELETVPLEIAVRYQACDERECFLPRDERLHLDVPVRRLNTRPRPA